MATTGPIGPGLWVPRVNFPCPEFSEVRCFRSKHGEGRPTATFRIEQGPEIRDGFAPDVIYAEPDDPVEGVRDRWPGNEATIRPREGRHCASQHLVLRGTYTPLRQEYAALVTWRADAARRRRTATCPPPRFGLATRLTTCPARQERPAGSSAREGVLGMFTKLADTSKAAIFSVLVLCMALVAAYLIAPASAFGEASRAAEPDFAAIDRYVEKEMQTQRIPGLALGIVKGDRIVHLEGFGKAEPSGR